jgi:hypothetical protein
VTDRLDQALERLEVGADRLAPRARSALFASCGDALLPLYREFHRETSWGDPATLERALELARLYAGGEHPDGTAPALERLSSVVPDGADFPTTEATWAQDAAICVAAALRPAAGEPQGGGSFYYAFEPIVGALSVRDNGVSALGSGPEEERWRNGIVDDPAMQEALGFGERAIEDLRDLELVPTSTQDRLRKEARALLADGAA